MVSQILFLGEDCFRADAACCLGLVQGSMMFMTFPDVTLEGVLEEGFSKKVRDGFAGPGWGKEVARLICVRVVPYHSDFTSYSMGDFSLHYPLAPF